MTTTGRRGNTASRQLDARLSADNQQRLRKLIARHGRVAMAKRLGVGDAMFDKLEGGGATTQAAIDRIVAALENEVDRRDASVDSSQSPQGTDRQSEVREQGRRCALVRIPYRLQSSANLREHHFAKAKRVAEERALARMHLSGLLLTKGITARFAHGKDASKARLWFPVVVTFTRFGPQRLDDDNMQGACKALRDGVADAMGTRDNDDRITWQYRQENGEYAIHIQVTETDVASSLP